MATGIQAFLDHALDQIGDQVRYGAEVTQSQADAKVWDSSELVEWAATRAGATMADGSYLQYRALAEQGAVTPVAEAAQTPGALLFSFSSDPVRSMPGQRQVYISLGNGKAIEATEAHGVRIVDTSTLKLTHAAVVPGFDAADAPDLRAHLDERLGALGVDVPVTTPPPSPSTDAPTDETPTDETPAPTPVPTPTTGDGDGDAPPPPRTRHEGDALTLRKQSIDLRQEAEQLRADATKGEQHQLDLVQQSNAARAEVDGAVEAMVQGRTLGTAAKEKADALDKEATTAQTDLDAKRAGMTPDAIKAAEDRIAETHRQAEQHQAEANKHFDDVLKANERMPGLEAAAQQVDDRIDRTVATIAKVRADADALDKQASEIFSDSNLAASDLVPANPLHGAGPFGQPAVRDVKLVDVPAAPPEGATRDQLREWAKQRDLATQSREDAAAEKLRDAADLDNVAETKTTLAAGARTRAEEFRTRAATEQARVDDLRTRLADADAQEARFSKEMIEEQRQAEHLRGIGDTQGADAADARSDRVMEQEMSWSVQAADLRKRMETAQQAASTALADAADYDRIAAGFVDETKMARDLADQYEQQARTWQQEADHLDTATDQVEDVLGADIRSEVHVITPTEDLEVDIPGRDPSTIPPDELHEKLPATAPQPTATDGEADDASVEPAAAATSVASTAGVGIADVLTGDTSGGLDVAATTDVTGIDAALPDVATTDMEIDPTLIEIEPMEPVADVSGGDALADVEMSSVTETMPADIASVDAGPDDTTFDTA